MIWQHPMVGAFDVRRGWICAHRLWLLRDTPPYRIALPAERDGEQFATTRRQGFREYRLEMILHRELTD